MTTLHFINTYGVICKRDDQDSYEEWSAAVDGKLVEDFTPGNRMQALDARDNLIRKYPTAKVIYVDTRMDYRGNRVLPGAVSNIVSEYTP